MKKNTVYIVNSITPYEIAKYKKSTNIIITDNVITSKLFIGI